MEYCCYIIYSAALDRYYVGHTENIAQRMIDHLSGISAYTAKAKDWVLKYSEPYDTREAASKREREIKQKKSRKYIEWLISQQAG